jgi:hypothetical protein
MKAKPLTAAVMLCLAVPLISRAQQPAQYGYGSFGMVLQPGPQAPAPMQGVGPANPGPMPFQGYGPTAPGPNQFQGNGLAGQGPAMTQDNGLTPLPGSAAESWVSGIGNLPVGKDGPIGEELFFYQGPVVVAGTGTLANKIDTGWMVEGGGRALLFNRNQDGAWTLSTGVAFQYNNGTGNAGSFDYFGLPVDVRNLFRVSATASVGYDWFRQGMMPFGNGQDTLRYGLDFGGRFGFEHVDLNVLGVTGDPFNQDNYLYHSHTYGGLVWGLHVDGEIPMGGWVFVAGMRLEYDYNWGEVLVTANSTVCDFNILFTIGIRY